MRAVTLSFSFTLLVLSSTLGCASGEPLTGTWTQPNATTQLPPSLGGGILNVNATLLGSSPRAFDMTLALETLGLTDTIRLRGTYVQAGTDLTLELSGFVIDPASMNTSRVSATGEQCIVLMGFAGTEVCFPTPQTHPYSVSGNTLTMTLDHEIAGAATSQTHFALTRSP